MRSTLGGVLMVVTGIVIAISGDLRGLVLSFVGVSGVAIGVAFFSGPTTA